MAENNLIGTRIGTYQILQEIGQGGNAIVYLARDDKLDRVVAIKMMHAFAYHPHRQKIIDRFRRGARAAARLNHPNILPVYDFGEWQETFYIVMQYVQGKTLRQHLQGNADWMHSVEPLLLHEVLPIIQQICAALTHAHQHGVVHRDVKPSNILLSDDGRIYLTDFGLAHVEDAAPITQSGETLGTSHYMSPEQGQGLPIDHRSDIYSLGVVVFQMLTGQVPFDANTPAPVILKHIVEPLPSPRSLNPNIPPMVEVVLRKTLTKNPSGRYQTIKEFIQDLTDAVEGKSEPDDLLISPPVDLPPANTVSLSPPVPAASPPNKSEGKASARLTLIGIILGTFIGLVVCGAAAFFLLGGSDLLGGATATPTQLAAVTPTATQYVAAPLAASPSPVVSPTQAEVATPTENPESFPSATLAAEPTSTEAMPTKTDVPPSPTLMPTPLFSATPTETSTPRPTSPPPVPQGMILIPSGDFIQGSSDAEIDAVIQMCSNAYGGTCPHPRDWFADETPRRTVYLDAFYIDKWEVTNSQFAAFVTATGYQTDAENRGEGQTWHTFNTIDREQYPVIWMSWNDANAYCRWAEKRLPSEAEWEKAARGDDGRIWPWGSNWGSGRANASDGGAGSVVAVGSYSASASPYGVMDMAGNVWEWVADWYDAYWYNSSPTRNPDGPDQGVSRVLRGGGFNNPPWEVRVVHRHNGGPGGYASDHGFRCAK